MPAVKTISVRQPWAWLIVNGYKTVENRSRSLGDLCGPLLIHAGQTLTEGDYDACSLFLISHPLIAHLGSKLPARQDLDVGGIVGQVNVLAKIENWPGVFKDDALESAWYTGDIGYWLSHAKPLPFKKCKGKLGAFMVDYEGLE